jgi:hypothetical protein
MRALIGDPGKSSPLSKSTPHGDAIAVITEVAASFRIISSIGGIDPH